MVKKNMFRSEVKKCAVIGGNGYIGKHLIHYLRLKGMSVMSYDIHEIEKEGYQCLDMTNLESLKRLDLNVDLIFMLAGLNGTHAGFEKYSEFISINEIGLVNLLDYIRKSLYRPKIIYPSSRLVYKGSEYPIREGDEKECKSIYAVNKLACEGLLQAYRFSFDIPFTVFRICIPYGNMLSSDYSYGTVGFFIKQAKQGKDITLFGGGLNKRTFTHMEDMCYQIVEGALKNESDGEIYNVGGEVLSLYQAANVIASKYNVKVVSVPWPERDLRIESGHSFFDDSKIRHLLGDIQYKCLKDFSKDI